ncbi:hypothetical protein LCGC14_0056290 [marine sediment metagenome]|uniref:Uncharacterized protein n=1 Tax=marine sediment metagenome TaxID=412755 RepID=A0A0F9Y6U1_9ZZZZ|nr:heparinase II/III family protein [Halomonas sp.]HDZ49577.1 hypothetical protein [Halomonas sp.]HEB06496.1 hypothetical protein [Halomonas sp.]
MPKLTNEKLAAVFEDVNALANGELLFEKGLLTLGSFKPVAFIFEGAPLNWEQDPLNNRSWQWRLNWLSFIPYLIALHRKSNDNEVLDLARTSIESWLDSYLETNSDYPFEFIWHDHATALRAEQLVLLSYYCREYAPEWAKQNTEFLEYLARAVVVHGEWLAQDDFYSEHTNHGLEQARVLLFIGTLFDWIEQAGEWQSIALQRITSELEFAFTDEGVHVENSPAYHVFVFKVFIGIIKDYHPDVLGDLAVQFEQFSAKALNFITHILRPDGKLPPVGDTEQLPTTDAYQEMFGHTVEYQHFLYAISLGKQGEVPAVLNRVYPMSGYAIFRDRWPAKEHYSKAFHIIAKVGCSSQYHHQQDEGHISLYGGGEDWLIDSGLYNYINKDPIRKYMRSRAGHNVPMVSHASYAKDFNHRLSSWQIEDYSEVAVNPHLSMKIEVLLPVVHTRLIDFDRQAKVVEVEDSVVADDGQLRDITLQWHFPHDKTITIDENRVAVTSPTGNQLKIDFIGEVPSNLSVATGQKEDRVFSCISYHANKVETSKLLRVVFKNRAELKVVTRFIFQITNENIAPSLEPAIDGSQPLGIMLQRWQESGQSLHTVVLGSGNANLELAKWHREEGFGYVSSLVNDAQQCKAIRKRVGKHYLASWLNCHSLDVIDTSPIAFNKHPLQCIEGVSLLIITKSGFKEEDLGGVVLGTLPLIVERMTNSGHIWISPRLPEHVKEHCEYWATQYKLTISYVTGLE